MVIVKETVTFMLDTMLLFPFCFLSSHKHPVALFSSIFRKFAMTMLSKSGQILSADVHPGISNVDSVVFVVTAV